jgi:hypothetical protein
LAREVSSLFSLSVTNVPVSIDGDRCCCNQRGRVDGEEVDVNKPAAP